jgi:shikimate dehydrogenase
VSQRWACLLGNPVGHSLSPAMHNAAFRALGIDARYDARQVAADDLADAVTALRAADCLGANVTVPYKQAVVGLLDGVADAARQLGAVNTIVRMPDGTLCGSNTDGDGLERWLRDAGAAESVAHGDTLVLGAGGAARATVLALARCGARSIRVLNRTSARLDALVDDLRPHLGAVRLESGSLDLVAQPTDRPVDVVVNATSLGLVGRAPPVHPSWYASRPSWAIDLVYNPPDTAFMQAARSAGARAENGLGMLVHQAALAFELWTGQEPPVAILETAAMSALVTSASPQPGPLPEGEGVRA